MPAPTADEVRRTLATALDRLPEEEAFALVGQLFVFMCLYRRMTLDGFGDYVQLVRSLFQNSNCRTRFRSVRGLAVNRRDAAGSRRINLTPFSIVNESAKRALRAAVPHAMRRNLIARVLMALA